MPPGVWSREFSESHGVLVGAATSSPPAVGRAAGGALGVGHLEGEPELRADPPAHLDPVDELDLRGVADLEGRPSGVEDHHLGAALALDMELDRHAEGVAVEGHRLLVVLGVDGEA